MCLLYDVPAKTECRLWQESMIWKFELLSKLSQTISDAGLCGGKVGVV